MKIPTIAASAVPTPPPGQIVIFADSSNSNRTTSKDSDGNVYDLTLATNAPIIYSEIMVTHGMASGIPQDGFNWIFFKADHIDNYTTNSQVVLLSLTSLIIDGSEKISSPTKTFWITSTNVLYDIFSIPQPEREEKIHAIIENIGNYPKLLEIFEAKINFILEKLGEGE